MKTKPNVVVSHLQRFLRPASLIMAGLAAAVLVSSSVFAQTDNGLGPEMSIEHEGIPAVSDPGDPWDFTRPSLADPALAPAPKQQVEPPLPQMHGGFLPEQAGPLIEPGADPAIPATSPMVVSPPGSMVQPGGGLFSPLR
jgi:hypothetical protein